MTSRARHRPNHSLARAFVRNARSFHEMAEAARSRASGSSAYYLAIAVELGLKAYLLHRGITDEWNRAHIGHDLDKALRCARMAGLQGLSGAIPQLAETLTPPYVSGALSRGLGEPSLPSTSDAAHQAILDLLNGVENALDHRGAGT